MTQEEMLTQIMTAVSTMKDEMSAMNKRFDRVEADLSGVKADLSGVKDDLSGVKADLSGVKDDTQRTREIVTRMEIEHGQKLGALFDANSMNYEKIKDEITPVLEKHDEDIEKIKIHVSGLRRVK